MLYVNAFRKARILDSVATADLLVVLAPRASSADGEQSATMDAAAASAQTEWLTIY